MWPPLSLTEKRGLTTAYVLAFSLWTSSVSAATIDIDNYFTVAKGSVAGSCDKYTSVLSGYLEEAFEIGGAGSDAINNLIGKQGTPSSVRLLWMLNGIGAWGYTTGTAKLSKADQQLVLAFQDGIEAAIDQAAIQALKPRLYCDSSMLVWTTKAYDLDTGKPTDQDLSEVEKFSAAYWFPDGKGYSQDAKGSATSTPCDGTGTMAFTMNHMKTIVLCSSLLDSTDWKTTLAPYKNDQTKITAGDDLYNNYKSIPGAFLHELTHLTTSVITDIPEYDSNGDLVPNELSYGYDSCVNLAHSATGPSLAPLNADSYHTFSLASYLDAWDWSTSKAKDPSTMGTFENPDNGKEDL
jgi:hypothetical protein